VGPRAGLDDVEKRKFYPESELRPLRREARSQSRYRLRYLLKCQIFSLRKVLSRAVLPGIPFLLQMGIKPGRPQGKKNGATRKAGKTK
jgi:hypothetical protein